MISFTVPYVFAAILGANLLILLLGSILFVWWVIRTVGVLKAAEAGSLLDKSVERARTEISSAVVSVFNKVDEQRVLVMTMTTRLKEIAESLSPASVENAIETRAQQISWATIDAGKEQRLHAERRLKRFEQLVHGMTGTTAELAEVVRAGLTGQWDPNLRGRVETYCAQRGVRVGGPKKSATGFERESMS